MINIGNYKTILIAIIIVAISFFALKGMIHNYSVKIAELNEKLVELDKGKELIERWETISRQYEMAAKNFFTKDPAIFKQLVERQAQQVGINLGTLTPTKKEESFYWTAAVNLKCYANSYDNIVAFVRGLEEKGVLVDILKIRRGSENRREAEIYLKTYVLK